MAKFTKRSLETDEPLGKQLRAVRRTAKLSLEQVAAATKIRKKFIKALEDGNYDEFPGEVYLRGFLENYAKFLGFPADEVLLQYKRERGITAPTTPKLKLPTRELPKQRVTVTPRTLGLGAAGLGLFIAVGYLVSQISGFASPPDLELYKPSQNATVTADQVEVEGKTDSGAELSINSQPVPTDTSGNFKEQVRLLPGNNTLQIVAKNKSGRERSLSRTVILSGSFASPTPAPTPPPSGLLAQIVVGPKSAYVTINADGKQVFQGLLLPNSQQVFSATQRILVTTSNAGSTKVVLNGQDKGPIGQEGQFRRGVEYTLADVVAAPPTATPAPR